MEILEIILEFIKELIWPFIIWLILGSIKDLLDSIAQWIRFQIQSKQ